MFVNNHNAIITTLKRTSKLSLVDTRDFPAPYMQYIFLDIKIYIILQVIIDFFKTILSVKLTTVNENYVVK